MRLFFSATYRDSSFDWSCDYKK